MKNKINKVLDVLSDILCGLGVMSVIGYLMMLIMICKM